MRHHRLVIVGLPNPVACGMMIVGLALVVERVLELFGLEFAAAGRGEPRGLTGEARLATGGGDRATMMISSFVRVATYDRDETLSWDRS